jgi:hypothetical protein
MERESRPLRLLFRIEYATLNAPKDSKSTERSKCLVITDLTATTTGVEAVACDRLKPALRLTSYC